MSDWDSVCLAIWTCVCQNGIVSVSYMDVYVCQTEIVSVSSYGRVCVRLG